jgi:glucose-1-phosphate cytidylyltransferase
MGIKAVILCGGQGTRIREASESMPKPMLPIGGKPIVWHIMKMYAAHGINEFVLCLGYKSWMLKEYFLNYRAMQSDVTVTMGKNHSVEFMGTPEEEWKVTLAETGEETMTGGRVASIRKYVENDELFCLTYGDGVSDVNITELLAFHRASKKIATVTAVRPPGRFGEMDIKDNLVKEFNEKPQTTEGFINGGFFVCDSKKIWDHVPNQKKLTFEREPLQSLAEGNQLGAYKHTGFWQPMDTLREFTMLNDLWASGKAPWMTWKDSK